MRKGDFNLSFNMIISIIVIAVVIGVSFYTITYFLDLKRCSELGLFNRDFQGAVDRAWNADIVEAEVFQSTVPDSVDKICLGNLSAATNAPEYSELRIFAQRTANLFFYPRQKCDIQYANINHVQLNGFRCFDTKDGKFSVHLNKGSFDPLVSVSP